MKNCIFPFNPRILISALGEKGQSLIVFDSNNNKDLERSVVSLVLPTFDRASIGSFSLIASVDNLIDYGKNEVSVKGKFSLHSKNNYLNKNGHESECEVLANFNFILPKESVKQGKFNFFNKNKQLSSDYTQDNFSHALNQGLSNTLFSAMSHYINKSGRREHVEEFKAEPIPVEKKYVRWSTFSIVAPLVFIIAFIGHAYYSSDDKVQVSNSALTTQGATVEMIKTLDPVNNNSANEYVLMPNDFIQNNLANYLENAPSSQDLYNAVNTPAQNSNAVDQQVEVTKQQLKKMGLDTGTASDTGCFAPQ
ncbi:hypothetical protein [Yersinia ruckeri]